MLRELQNPEDIVLLVREINDPMAILKTSSPTASSTEYGNDPAILYRQRKY